MMNLNELVSFVEKDPYTCWSDTRQAINRFEHLGLWEKNPVGALRFIDEHLADKSVHYWHNELKSARKHISDLIYWYFSIVDAKGGFLE